MDNLLTGVPIEDGEENESESFFADLFEGCYDGDFVGGNELFEKMVADAKLEVEAERKQKINNQ